MRLKLPRYWRRIAVYDNHMLNTGMETLGECGRGAILSVYEHCTELKQQGHAL